jgi:transposase
MMLPTSTRIFVCTQPVDLRKSFDGLARCTRELLECDPTSGAVFLFTGKRGSSMKVLWWDRSGYCILYKRLTRGMFRIPAAASGATSVAIDAHELVLILEGIELPSRKQRMKSATKEGRTKALRVISTLSTDDRA